MDPTYTTTDPSGLFLTTSGLALDAPPGTLLTPVLYDPATMSTPWMDASGVNVAMLPDGTIVPVAISSAGIEEGWAVPSVLTNLATTGLESFATQLQRWLNPAYVAPGGAVAPASPLGGMSMTTMLLLGIGAYFLFIRKK
jgi:hypothetical protein